MSGCGEPGGSDPRRLRIISGGQTGVDRGALNAAIQVGLDHGGWCPLGRRAEDGCIPDRYRLTEMTSRDYALRTEQNVIDSDATLILHRGELSGGTQLTYRFAHKHRKPVLLIDLSESESAEPIRAWLEQHHVQTLNCAGPRESGCPGIEHQAEAYLVAAWSRGSTE